MTLLLPTGTELLLVVGLTLAPCAAVALIGVLLLRRPGRRSVRGWVLGGAAGSVVVTCAGVVVASRAMFLSPHDLGLLVTVLALAAAAGGGCALLLATTLARESGRLVQAAAAVGGDDPVWTGPLPAVAELAAVARQLQRTSDDLATARRDAAAAERSRLELATWMSHDLRTPLAGLRAMAEALEDDVVTDRVDVARYHRQMRADAERLSAMVDDLFELSRLQAEPDRPAAELVDLCEVVEQTVGGCRAVGPARPWVVGLPDHPVPVRASAQDLSRALGNLLVNAQRYSPAGTSIEVRVGVDADRVRVAVADRCGGLPPADRDRVFEVGFRGSAARTPDGGAGAGLGLAIARRLVEAHGGSVAVQDEADGCCFTVDLPLAHDGCAPVGFPVVARLVQR